MSSDDPDDFTPYFYGKDCVKKTMFNDAFSLPQRSRTTTTKT